MISNTSTTDPTLALAEQYARELDALTESIDRFMRFVGDAFAGPDDANKLRRAHALILAAADRDNLAGMLNRAAFGQKRENRLRAVANSFTAFMDDNGSLADKARNTVVTMTAAGHHNPAWPVFHVEDFAEFRIRDDFDGDRRPPFGELFAIWQSLRKDHPLRDAFTTADLLDLKIGACVVLTDNKLIAADRAGLPRIFELADVRRMTKLGRDALMRRQREAAEQADRDRIEAEERYRASPEGKIAALESEVKALREQLAARA